MAIMDCLGLNSEEKQLNREINKQLRKDGKVLKINKTKYILGSDGMTKSDCSLNACLMLCSLSHPEVIMKSS